MTDEAVSLHEEVELYRRGVPVRANRAQHHIEGFRKVFLICLECAGGCLRCDGDIVPRQAVPGLQDFRLQEPAFVLRKRRGRNGN